MKWVTRERPKIDRIACPWLILRFIDPEAELLYVPPTEVLKVAAESGAIPYDVPNVELAHMGELCSFDAFLSKYALNDPALQQLAAIVRGADTARLDLAPQAAGLLAVSLGLSHNYRDDHAMFVVGTESVAVIGSGYDDPMAAELIERIRAVTDKPVRYVINTNSQPHRVLDNARFRSAGAQIIAATGAVARLTGEGETMAASAATVLGLPAGSIGVPGAPDRAIETDTELDLGGVKLRLIPVGTAHTAGSLLVEVVEDRVVFAGDVLYAGRLLAVLPVSRVSGWIAAFVRLRTFGDALFVPGHGNPGPLADFEHPSYAYLSALKSHMDAAVESGADISDAIAGFDQSPWQKLADFRDLAGRNAHQTYLESEAAAFD